ncbi:unnamed protein product [Phytomonas sp. Hart1]|nr:unnamed protein product [Phytomonas sp. Hart1]|eukprot:CCW70680.1 unnamed protein product [Phytomonas sp. isolate Hart1]
MGPVEMLTIIENKLEEYNRYVMDPTNGIEEGLIQAVLKAGDKERRLLTRLQLIAEQERAQEERVRQALERSNAPVMRRIGKPVLPRSHLPRDGKTRTAKRASIRKDELEESIQKFFR